MEDDDIISFGFAWFLILLGIASIIVAIGFSQWLCR